jgi:hypothetical protein
MSGELLRVVLRAGDKMLRVVVRECGTGDRMSLIAAGAWLVAAVSGSRVSLVAADPGGPVSSFAAGAWLWMPCAISAGSCSSKIPSET